jgi:16S rRNA processing protein RimM
LRGGLKFKPDDPGSTLFDQLERVFIEQPGAPVEYRLIEVAPLNPRQMKIMVEGVSDVNAAEQLRGATVFAAKSDLPPIGENEFYYFQTAGCEVRTTDGRIVGHIKSTFFSGAHDIWVVEGDGAEFMVPVIEDVVKSIDIEARRVTIEPLPGLLD